MLTAGCLATSLASTHQVPVASTPSHDCQEGLQIVPDSSYSTPTPWEPLNQIEINWRLTGGWGWDFPGGARVVKH